MNTELARQIRFAEHRHLDPVNDNHATGFGIIGSVALIVALVAISIGTLWGIFHLENLLLARIGR